MGFVPRRKQAILLDCNFPVLLSCVFHTHTVIQIHCLMHSCPDTGFNVETVEYKNISFTVWDVGGQDKVLLLSKCTLAHVL